MKELDREVQELSNDIAQIEAVILINIRRIKESSSSIIPDSNSATIIKDKIKDSKMDVDVVDLHPVTLNPSDLELLKQDNEQLLRDRSLLCNVARQKIHDKKAIAKSLIEMINQFEQKLDSDLAHFEQDLKLSGDYEAPIGIAPDSEVRNSLFYPLME